jgi:hypothetical protein
MNEPEGPGKDPLALRDEQIATLRTDPWGIRLERQGRPIEQLQRPDLNLAGPVALGDDTSDDW